jgi:hypothetical protein
MLCPLALRIMLCHTMFQRASVWEGAVHTQCTARTAWAMRIVLCHNLIHHDGLTQSCCATTALPLAWWVRLHLQWLARRLFHTYFKCGWVLRAR